MTTPTPHDLEKPNQLAFIPPSQIEKEKTWNAFYQDFSADYPELLLRSTLDAILSRQALLAESETEEIDPSDSFPYKVLIQRTNFQIIIEQVGEGTYCLVYEDTLYPTHSTKHQTPRKPQTYALKMAKHERTQFSPDKRKLEQACRGNFEGLDQPLMTFTTSQGTSCSLHELYERTLRSLRYASDEPANELIDVLTGAVTGLFHLHQGGYVHRDIKGTNVFSKKNKGALGDFGTLTPEKKKPHRTTGTPLYLDPEDFGSPKSSVAKQKSRTGRQSKEGDIFGTGRMIERDGLLRCLYKLAQKQGKVKEINPLIEQLKPSRIQGPFSEIERRNYGITYPHRIHHFEGDGVNPEYLLIYKKHALRLRLLNQIIGLLTDSLPDHQSRQLYGLAELAIFMQQEKKYRPDAESVKLKLESLRNQEIRETPSSPVTRKRTAHDVEEEENYDLTPFVQTEPTATEVMTQIIESSPLSPHKRRCTRELDKPNSQPTSPVVKPSTHPMAVATL